MFVCPIITRTPLDPFASIFIGELGRPIGLFLASFRNSKRVGPLLYGKIAEIVIFDKVRVIGGKNYDFSGNRRVPNLSYKYAYLIIKSQMFFHFVAEQFDL